MFLSYWIQQIGMRRSAWSRDNGAITRENKHWERNTGSLSSMLWIHQCPPTEKYDKIFLLAILGEWVCLGEMLASVFFAFLEMRQLLSLLIVYRLWCRLDFFLHTHCCFQFCYGIPWQQWRRCWSLETERWDSGVRVSSFSVVVEYPSQNQGRGESVFWLPVPEKLQSIMTGEPWLYDHEAGLVVTKGRGRRSRARL